MRNNSRSSSDQRKNSPMGKAVAGEENDSMGKTNMAKAKDQIKEKEFNILQVIFAASFFAVGLFHEYMSCIFAGTLGIHLLYLIYRRQKFIFYCNMENIIVCIIVLMYLAAGLYGIDSGMGVIGFGKNLVILMMLFCLMQFQEAEREKLMQCLPHVACLMVSACIIFGFIPALRENFYAADRLGGFFQYANVFALFCLIGMICCNGNKNNVVLRKNIIQTALLMTGILLSGSRTVMALTIVICIILAVYNKKIRLSMGIFLGVTVLAVGIYVGITGEVQNIGRLVTASVHSSTFIGRILYIKDALPLLLEYPFGMGYLGYYFIEPSIQTGLYSVRYIHNDYLQLALDIGIMSAVLFGIVLWKNILSKKRSAADRLLLLVIAIHCIVDFDLEFTSIWLVLLLALPVSSGKRFEYVSEKKYNGKNTVQSVRKCGSGETGRREERHYRGKACCGWKIFVAAASVFAVYLGIFMLPRYAGNAPLSAKMLPFYTEARTEALQAETDSKDAGKQVEEILRQNEYIAEAYDVSAILAYQDRDYDRMVQYKEKSLELQKYNMDAYSRYVILLSRAISGESDLEKQMVLAKEVIHIKEILEKVKQDTDSLAWQTRDAPDFELPEEVEVYIQEITDFMQNMGEIEM